MGHTKKIFKNKFSNIFRWISQVDENQATYEEQKLFQKTDHVLNVVSYTVLYMLENHITLL
jgi:hypothetical protein